MPELRTFFLLLGALLARLLHAARARARGAGARRADAGEIVTWVILAAGLAVVALAVVAIVAAKLRSTAEGIQLE
jgi:hypothetical protein